MRSFISLMLLFICSFSFCQTTITDNMVIKKRIELRNQSYTHWDSLGRRFRLQVFPTQVVNVLACGNAANLRNMLVRDTANRVFYVDFDGCSLQVSATGGSGGGGNGIYGGSGSLPGDVTVSGPSETTLAFDITDGYYSFDARQFGSFTVDFDTGDQFYLGELPFMKTNEFSFQSPTVSRLNVAGSDQSLLHVGTNQGFAGFYLNGDSVSVLRIGGITIQSDTNQLVPYTLSLPDTLRTGVLRAVAANGKTFFDPNFTAPPSGAAGGDLSGTYPNPTVARIQGRSVTSTAPTTNQVIKWNGSAWAPAADATGASVIDEIGYRIDTLVEWNEYPLFITTNTLWEQVTVGSGGASSVSASNQIAGRPGVIQVQTGTGAAASQIGLSYGNGNQGHMPAAGVRVRSAFNIPSLPVTADSIVLKCGFHTRATTVGAAGAYFQIRTLGTGANVVQAITSTGSAQTVTDVTVAAGTLANTWKTWEVRYNSASSVSFLCEDVVVATHTTNVDNGGTNRHFPCLYFGRSGAGTGNMTALFDYIAFYFPCVRN
jgi:hypothetical protein